MEYLNLNTGAQIPMVGFGVFRVPDLQECENAVYEAIRIGYRLVDTATAYKNEEAVGAAVRRAIADGICTREELFVTSKLWVTDMSDEETAARAIDASLDRLDIGYLDLYLEHQALNDYFAAWRSMQRAYEAGKLRAIGVSNFYPNILTNFCEVVDVVPAVNQVELHPYYTQEGALETMAHYGVVPEAWAPLGGGRYNPFEDEGFRAIAEVHGKTVRAARRGRHPQVHARGAHRRELRHLGLRAHGCRDGGDFEPQHGLHRHARQALRAGLRAHVPREVTLVAV